MYVLGVGVGRTGTRSLEQALKQWYSSVIHCPATYEEIIKSRAAVEGAVLNNWQAFLAIGATKFILTMREDEEWLASSKRAMVKYPIERLIGTKWLFAAYRNRMYRWGTIEYDRPTMLKHFHDHNDQVRDLVPKDRLLVMQPCDCHWQQLCEFLSQDKPDIPYPNVRDTADGIRTHGVPDQLGTT